MRILAPTRLSRLLLLCIVVFSIQCHGSHDSDPLLCVLVPFRDGCGLHSGHRSEQLDTFIHNLTVFLEDRGHQSFHFLVSEQSQRGHFNKGLIYNLGVLQAYEMGCDYVVLHDVDQLPTNEGNDYFYRGHPLHMCSWSTQYIGEIGGFQPHVGGAMMMSIADYAAVNGFSNEYWRWGYEDNDLYERLYTVFGGFARLNQTVGSYVALPHPRTHWRELKRLPEVQASLQRFEVSARRDAAAVAQMEEDGLRQACEYAELLAIRDDDARRLTVATWDLYPPHASSCAGSAPNASKAAAEDKLRRGGGRRGRCLALLQACGLREPSVASGRLCAEAGGFCVNARSTASILRSTARFDRAKPLPPAAGPRPAAPLPIRQPLQEWRRVVTPGMRAPFEWQAPSPPEVGHPFAMGWNESMAFLRLLARRRVPFTFTRYGDGELSILRNISYPAPGSGWGCVGHDCLVLDHPARPVEWTWEPSDPNAGRFRELLVQNFRDAQDAGVVAMVGLPLMFCAEGSASFEMGGGGNADWLRHYLQVPDLELHRIPANRLLYSWQFGNLNYNATLALVDTLVQAEWPILLICNRDRVAGRMAPAWAAGVLTVEGLEVADMAANSAHWEEEAAALAESINGTAVLFSVGPISNAWIGVMHRANPRNIYLDVGAVLDFVVSGERTREFHPRAGDPSHFVRAGGALRPGQDCTEARWLLGPNGFVHV